MEHNQNHSRAMLVAKFRVQSLDVNSFYRGVAYLSPLNGLASPNPCFFGHTQSFGTSFAAEYLPPRDPGSSATPVHLSRWHGSQTESTAE